MPGGLDWREHGLVPRWLDMDTSDCVVAIEPGFFHNRGADERDRFLAGASSRGELALVIAVIGDTEIDGPRDPLSRFDSSVSRGTMFTSVHGRRLPAGTRPEIAPDLRPADRDLALRLLNRPADAPWWGLQPPRLDRHAATARAVWATEPRGRWTRFWSSARRPGGRGLDPPSGDQRWYITLDAIDWDNVLGWLVQQVLAEYVPDALRRPGAVRICSTASCSTASGTSWSTLWQKYSALVLRAADLCTLDLDQELGGTQSVDLLVSAGSGPPRASSRSEPPAARLKNGSSGTSSGGSARRLSPGLVDRVAAGDLRHGDAGALGHSALGGRRDHPVAIATRYQVGLAFQAELGRGRPPRRPGHRPRPGGAWSGAAHSRP